MESLSIGYIAAFEKQLGKYLLVINLEIENKYIEVYTDKKIDKDNIGVLYRFKINKDSKDNYKLLDFYTIYKVAYSIK